MNLRPLLLFLAVLMVTGCNDSENLIGGSIRPTKDIFNVAYTESVPITAQSFKPGPLQTGQGIANYDFVILGGIKPNDATTGIYGDFATNFWIDALGIKSKPDTTIVLDSVILIMLTYGYYGDTLGGLNYLEVFELDKELGLEDTFYTNEDPQQYYSEDKKIGELQYQPYDYSVPDSVRLRSGYVNTINVPIDKSIGQRFIDNLQNINNPTDNRSSLEVFRDLFKGIYVKSTLGQKAVVYMYPFLNRSGVIDFSTLNLVYHYVPDTSQFGKVTYYTENIILNNECAFFNAIRQSPGTYNYETTVQPELLYLQGLGVSEAKINIPPLYALDAFKAKEGEDSARIAINSAKLVFKMDEEMQMLDKYVVPSKLVIRREIHDEENGSLLIRDELLLSNTSQGYIDGSRTIRYTYEFNIAEYVQELLDKKTETPSPLILKISGSRNNPAFTFLKGVSNTDNLKLEIVYSRY